MDIFNKLIDFINTNFSLEDFFRNPLFLVDVFIVLLLFYWIYRMLKNTRAVRIFYGLIFLGILLFLSSFFNLTLLSLVLGAFLTITLVAIPIVFQPELRNALEKIGRTGLTTVPSKETVTRKYIDSILDALSILSRNKKGGIIAIQRKTGLKDYLRSGIRLDAEISKELLLSCFADESPLHDGAVIISKGRIMGASCILPLSESDKVTMIGTRHKAAMGLSEQTDAVVLVISEKTGEISVAKEGNLFKNITLSEARKIIEESLKDDFRNKTQFLDYFNK